jgi:hypothetical protein
MVEEILKMIHSPKKVYSMRTGFTLSGGGSVRRMLPLMPRIFTREGNGNENLSVKAKVKAKLSLCFN